MVATATSVAACAPTGGSGDATGEPTSGGTLVFASNTDTNCLDPHQSAADVAGLYARPILDSLVALTDDGQVHPWLASSWDVSGDELTYTFHLREDVAFSNGEPFNAEAVVANFEHIVAPETASQLAAGYIEPYAGSTAVDEFTVDVTFSRPFSAFLPSLATAYFGMEAPSTLSADPAELCSVVVGTGPFISEKGYVPQEGISYVRNPDYDWAAETAEHDGPAYLEALEITIVPEDSVRIGALFSGEVDAIASVPPVQMDQIEADGSLYTDTAPAPGGNYNYYPNTESGPFSDLAVREAFRAGIDFDTLIEQVYFGAFEPADSPISPNTAYYDPSQEAAYQYDPDEAARLLDEAGWVPGDDGIRVKDGEPLTIRMPIIGASVREQRDTLAQQVQAAAREIGFDMVIDSMDIGAYVGDLGSGNYDLVEVSWQRASPDVLRTLFHSDYIPNGGFSTAFSRYASPVIDEALVAALATRDPDELAELYGTVQMEIADQALVFPQYVFAYLLGANTSVGGITWEPQAYPLFYDAWIAE